MKQGEGSLSSLLVALGRVALGMVMILPAAVGPLLLMNGLLKDRKLAWLFNPLSVVIVLFMLVGGILMVAFGAQQVRIEWSAWRRRRAEGREL